MKLSSDWGKLRLWPILVLSLFPLGALAQAAPLSGAKHCLWKVEGKTTVYLLGSIHFLKNEFYPLPAPIEAAFDASAIVGFETDLKGMEEPRNRARWSQMGLYTDGSTIKDHISPKTLEALQAQLRKTIGSTDALDRVKPWLASVTLMMAELHRLGFNPEQGVDKYFFRKALATKKSLISLESVESQLALFAGLSPREEEAFLVQTLQDLSRFGQFIQEIIDAWKAGENKKLAALLLDSMAAQPHLYRKFLTQRNEQWLPKIEQLLAGDKKGFLVVGAGHLVGTNSVVDLLQKKGYKVEQQ